MGFAYLVETGVSYLPETLNKYQNERCIRIFLRCLSGETDRFNSIFIKCKSISFDSELQTIIYRLLMTL